ncbi:BTB/POZ and MATH domain-containing protein 2-like [Miscanthus floridulus]|uniref:BTB/POZ and MATH domain-containing protein 2-like n=1 Tax=Miscanthus floridulus TaxID=154761 RepID=UPI00345AC841
MPDASHHGDAQLRGDRLLAALDDMYAGDYVSSGTFFVGGCGWSIKFFPDGDGCSKDDEAAAYTTVRLSLLDGPTGVRVKFSISLLVDKDSQAPSSGKKGKKKKKKKKNRSAGQGNKQAVPTARTVFTDTRTYDTDTEHHNNWGRRNFIEKSKLKELPHGFTIRCAVTVVKHRTEDAATVAAAPPSDLHRDFARMLEAADGADVTISIGDRFFLAHRYVLAARSRVFRAQLFGAMEESATGCVRVEDMEPSVIERLLHFVYTDSSPERSLQVRSPVGLPRPDRSATRLRCNEATHTQQPTVTVKFLYNSF